MSLPGHLEAQTALPQDPPGAVGGAREVASPVPGREQAHLTRSQVHTFIQQTSDTQSQRLCVQDAGSQAKSRELQLAPPSMGPVRGQPGAVSVGLGHKARVWGEV